MDESKLIFEILEMHLSHIQAGLKDVAQSKDYAIRHVAAQMKFNADDSVKMVGALKELMKIK